MRVRHLVLLLLLLLPGSTGCVSRLQQLRHSRASCPPPSDSGSDLVARIEYPDVERCGISGNLDSLPPRKLSDGLPAEFWDLGLEAAVRLGLQNSDVLKDLGGRVLDFPSGITSVYDPSITMSHPRLGEEAALAAFDAQLTQTYSYLDANDAYNSQVEGGGAFEVNRDLFRAQSELTKTAATGAQFSLRNQIDHDHSDSPANRFSHAWIGSWEASVRQPLLQGGGVMLNRIVGPNAPTDISLVRGVILARIDGDISLARFEQGVRDYTRDLETAYWQLYFAYRNLQANLRARDLARQTWLSVQARYEADLRRGEADVEAQAREQLYFFEQQVVLALNGATDGSGLGVYQAERRLRRMMGLPVNDGQLIRPLDEPTDAPVVFEWEGCLADALVRRVELRQQMWQIKQRELELLAARNFLLPRLDAVAAYRVSGFGDDLLGGSGPFSNLGRELSPFGNDQFELGMQLNVPLGYRREQAGVRHAELNLCRARAVLRDQEHLVSHNLGEALANLETTHETIRLAYQRMVAAEQVVESREAVFEAGKSSIENLLEAQRRLADAQIRYFQARVDHAQAIARVHLEKGTLLAYNGVHLSEGDWCRPARDQLSSEAHRHRAKLIDYRTTRPRVSLGPFDPAIDGTGVPVRLPPV